jgi:hypothetical protein
MFFTVSQATQMPATAEALRLPARVRLGSLLTQALFAVL